MIWFLSVMTALAIPIARVCPYPESWWKAIPPEEAQSWEILPQAYKCEDRKVILSKRNELGLLSNFAHTPFVFNNEKYESVEGFWQMMKYPENLNDKNDPRNHPSVKWALTRDQVAKLVGHEAKEAGKLANENLKKLGINWITFNGRRIDYKGEDHKLHYEIIFGAMRAKWSQNPKVKSILESTKGLQLLPDHQVDPKSPPAYRYYEIWMKIRDQKN